MLIQADNGELIEFSTQFINEKEKPMTNELPLIQQPLVATATPEQKLMAATLPPTANQQPAPEAKMPAKKEHGEGRLSDGREFTQRRPKGFDMQNAIRITKDPQEQSMVMAASVTKIGDAALTYEDFLKLDFSDCTEIITEFNTLVGN